MKLILHIMDKRKFNKGKKGNKGGGSHTVKDSIWHRERWELNNKVKELEAKIASGIYAIRDVWLLKALKGNDQILKQAADKNLADLHDVTSAGEAVQPVLVEFINGTKENKDS